MTRAPHKPAPGPGGVERWLETLIAAREHGEDWRSVYRRIDDSVDAEVTALIAKIPDHEKATLISRIQKRRKDLPLESEIAGKVLDICKQILTFGLAGLSLALAFFDKAKELPVAVQKTLAIGGFFYVELLLVSLVSLCVYLLTARFRYAFLFFAKIGNAWPFFYYGSVDPRLDIGLVGNILVRRSHMIENGALYARDYLTLAERVAKEPRGNELRNELQQYALLMAYQAYVHQHSLHFTNIFLYGLMSAVVASAALAILAVLGVL